MLGHRWAAHRQAAGKVADRGRPLREPFEDGTPGRVA
jgi:hypothetical protein